MDVGGGVDGPGVAVWGVDAFVFLVIFWGGGFPEEGDGAFMFLGDEELVEDGGGEGVEEVEDTGIVVFVPLDEDASVDGEAAIGLGAMGGAVWEVGIEEGEGWG